MTTSSTLLQELYEIDPSLREHEAELVPLIEQLLAHDPAQKPSAAFVQRLRRELQVRAGSYAENEPSPFFLFFSRFGYALAGATFALVVAIPATLQYASRVPSPTTDNGNAMETIGAPEISMMNDGSAPPTPGGLGGGTFRSQSGGGGDMAMSLIAPWNPVRYRLEGDLPELPRNVTVLERQLSTNTIPFSRIAQAFDIDRIDLSRFENAQVESVSIAQDIPFGYYVNLSLTDGSVSINQKWDRWPHPENECRDEACFLRLRPSIADIPADSDVLQIANAFLSDHAVDLSGYGSPIVDSSWRQAYDATPDKRQAWVPDTIRVIYPLLISGEPVIEVGGEPAGISVQVSIVHKRVSDVWGLTTYQFDRKTHDGVTDRTQVEAFLNQSGTQTPDAPTVTVSNPHRGYVRIYTYENNRNREYFVPALLFDVTNVPPSLGYVQRTVAAPLSQELLKQATLPTPIDPIPLPRPMDPAAAEPLM